MTVQCSKGLSVLYSVSPRVDSWGVEDALEKDRLAHADQEHSESGRQGRVEDSFSYVSHEDLSLLHAMLVVGEGVSRSRQ